MQVEEITDEHLPVILPWWADRTDQGEMPSGILPPLGYVAIDEQGPAAAAWMYLPEGCQLGIIDWMVGRPGMMPRIARAACRAVFAAIEGEARRRGFARLWCSTSIEGMAREAGHLGFTVSEPRAIHLTKLL